MWEGSNCVVYQLITWYPHKSTAGSSATLQLHIIWVRQCTRHGYFCLYNSQQLYNRGAGTQCLLWQAQRKQDHDKRPCRNLLSLKRGGVIGRTIRRCSGMCTWYRHWAKLISGMRHIHPFQQNSECLHMLWEGEGDAVRTDSFWHDPESRGRGTTKPNCFFLVTEFRLTHCEASEGGDNFGCDSISLFSNEYSTLLWMERRGRGGSAQLCCWNGQKQRVTHSVMEQKRVRENQNIHCL